MAGRGVIILQGHLCSVVPRGQVALLVGVEVGAATWKGGGNHGNCLQMRLSTLCSTALSRSHLGLAPSPSPCLGKAEGVCEGGHQGTEEQGRA